jgi:hypothetical protein
MDAVLKAPVATALLVETFRRRQYFALAALRRFISA